MPAPADSRLEEPYRLGDDMNFSPPRLEVRTSSVGTIVTARPAENSQLSPVTDISPASAIALRGAMLETYNNVKSSHVLTTADKSHINKEIKKDILGKLKFVQQKKNFGSFWKPDMLKDTPAYVDTFLDSYGSKYQDRKMSQHTLVQAVELWKASAPFLKKLIDNHRSAVAQKMKTDILTGKYNL
jgi:hypothetical protein